MISEEQAMKRALALALQGSGRVGTNPRVGAVILKNNEKIAESWHKIYGGPHAEVNAIEAAKGVDLEGATMAVNLEPCAHQGKTPPCVDAIIEKKFGRVVIGMKDPNPLVAGRGIEKLKEAGIDVEVGVLEKQSKWTNRFFIKHITEKTPYVVVKAAQSIDGCIASSTGASKWITGEASRKVSHRLRAEMDAILIGRKTALADNPKLTVRNVEGRNPKRVIFDTKLSLPLDLETFKNPRRTDTIICCENSASRSRKADNLKLAGIKILSCELDEKGKIALEPTLSELYEKFLIGSLLVEGGAGIFSSFASQNLIDELHIFIAPILLGSGLKTFGGLKVDKLDDAFKLNIAAIGKNGTDLHVLALKNGRPK